MNRNKRIIDCTPLEILNIGKQLIDYYYSKEFYEVKEKSKKDNYKSDFKEGDVVC